MSNDPLSTGEFMPDIMFDDIRRNKGKWLIRIFSTSDGKVRFAADIHKGEMQTSFQVDNSPAKAREIAALLLAVADEVEGIGYCPAGCGVKLGEAHAIGCEFLRLSGIAEEKERSTTTKE